MKQSKLIIGITFILIMLVVATELNKPAPINWKQSFSKTDEIPYGNIILFGSLTDLFPSQTITSIYQPIYNQMETPVTDKPTNYIFVNKSLAIDSLDKLALLKFVAEGNYAFIATEQLSQYLTDTLQIKMNYQWDLNWTAVPESTKVKGDALNFEHKDLRKEEDYQYKKYMTNRYFSEFDTTTTIVLSKNHANVPTFLQTDFGQGKFLLHANPLVFTNYNMVTDTNNATYISKALSHLPIGTVYWDEYYKVGRNEKLQTPLRYFLSNTALLWGVYTFLITLLLFVFFEAKRKQRIIPIIRPLANTTLDFTKTVGLLYFQHKDHKDLAEKKIIYFLDKIRKHFFIRYEPKDNEFHQRLAQKTGVPKADITNLFRLIQSIQQAKQIDESSLLALNQQIENFWKAQKI